jgi:hypothetical protein
MSMTPKPNRRDSRTCYMCDGCATSTEHAPPKCLFPEPADCDGQDYRKNLITVPSCESHNSQKSKDDEYLLYLLSSCDAINEICERHFATKVIRSITQRPSLMSGLIRSASLRWHYDVRTGEWHDSLAVPINVERVWSVLGNMGRALSFAHTGGKWLANVAIFPHFLHDDMRVGARDRMDSRKLLHTADAVFANASKLGENQAVFHYQLADAAETGVRILRATFFGGAKVTFGFLSRRNAKPRLPT